ncbi:MAG TPA: sporulation peptidase YabG [Bacillota bacterium]|nr:sporulation peptidase YabG [Bacillota bacterium]HNT04288.1 sporulation peptidase YabG [Bacillota bacterium]HPA55637.1 sporulation peptidase YabG [Bacillota bacterium]HPW41594.1 sporulation peptidase YabG [Bacillota bacterium]HPX69982.1 sporulation peptidase YabG [Bacillota bacterium]
MDIKVGDIVARKSYGFDILFKVHDIVTNKETGTIIYLKGLHYRLFADAPESDVVKVPMNRVNEEIHRFEGKIGRLTKARGRRAGFLSKKLLPKREEYLKFELPGKVLHIDGDKDYLVMSMKYYKEQGISAVGKLVPEADQPGMIKALLEEYKPDIVIITGHDSMQKQEAKGKDSSERYRNSKYFIEAVKEARKYQQSLDELVIIAGACQSYYEGILSAGANFASSPARILIHALDPGMLCRQIAFTPTDTAAPIEDVLKGTTSGVKGIGGIQTRGKFRAGMPGSPYIP